MNIIWENYEKFFKIKKYKSGSLYVIFRKIVNLSVNF